MNDNINLDDTQKIIDSNTSKRITSLRFLLIILVVFIHNCYTTDLIQKIVSQGNVPPVFVENAFGYWIKLLITGGIARAAVPLFFMFSAYLQSKKNYSYKQLLCKRAKTLLIPFIIWMALYTLYFAGIKLILLKIAPQFINNPDSTALNWTLTDWIHKILGYKNNGNAGFDPPEFAAQFWFIRDLIILIIISPIITKIIKQFPFIAFCLIILIYLIPVRIFFVENQAIFFYMLGIFWGIYDFDLFSWCDKIKWLEIIPLFIFTFIWTYTINKEQKSTAYWSMVIFACIILIKISFLLINKEKVYNLCTYLAGYSFFLFAIHEPVLNNIISKVWIRFFPMKNTFYCLCQYFIPSILTILIGTMIGIITKVLFPKLYMVLTGNR